MSRTDLSQLFSTNDFYYQKSWNPFFQPEPDWSKSIRQRQNGQVIRQGTVTPGFYSLRRTGMLPHNKFSYVELTKRCGYGFITSRYLNNYSKQKGVLSLTTYDPPALSSVVQNNLYNQVVTKLLLKLKDQDVNLFQAWAERDQTIRLLREAVTSIGKAYSFLRKGDFYGAAGALGIKNPGSSGGFSKTWRRNQSRAVAQGWLQLQYGWRPLIADVYGLCVHLQKTFEITHKVERISARSKYTNATSTSSRDGNRITTDEGLVDVEMSCHVYYVKADPTSHQLSSYGISNPLFIAWELTKFSFVVDWFVHIGNWISALDANLGYTFKAGSTTLFIRSERQLVATCNGPYQSYSEYAERQVWSSDKVECYRDPLTTWPRPNMPAFRDPASLEHTLNALALLKTLKR